MPHALVNHRTASALSATRKRPACEKNVSVERTQKAGNERTLTQRGLVRSRQRRQRFEAKVRVAELTQRQVRWLAAVKTEKELASWQGSCKHDTLAQDELKPDHVLRTKKPDRRKTPKLSACLMATRPGTPLFSISSAVVTVSPNKW